MDRWNVHTTKPRLLIFPFEQLAHYLRSSGVGPDERVGLCVERSPDLVVGLLGILKAGDVEPEKRCEHDRENYPANMFIQADTLKHHPDSLPDRRGCSLRSARLCGHRRLSV